MFVNINVINQNNMNKRQTTIPFFTDLVPDEPAAMLDHLLCYLALHHLTCRVLIPLHKQPTRHLRTDDSELS